MKLSLVLTGTMLQVTTTIGTDSFDKTQPRDSDIMAVGAVSSALGFGTLWSGRSGTPGVHDEIIYTFYR